MDNNNNFIAAVLLSIVILVGFHYLYEKPQLERAQQEMALHQEQAAAQAQVQQRQSAQPTATLVDDLLPREDVLKVAPRVVVRTPELQGSINLKGARLDDLSLVNYRETVEPGSPQIVLLSPAGSAAPHESYYASFGWLADADVAVPTDDTVWKADATTLTPAKPLHLTWDNGHGLVFERTIAVDDHFLFTVSDRVRNAGGASVTLYPYGLVSRHGKPQTADTYVLHEGPLGVLDGTLKEVKYKTLIEDHKASFESVGGWLGMTDKYWLVSLLPSQDEKIDATFTYTKPSNSGLPEQGTFQVDYRGTPVSLAAGASLEHKTNLFAGAKRVRLLDMYADQLNIPLFDRAIDFGWYYYLTKPFLYFLDFLNNTFGNMALAIVVLTLVLRGLALPLSLKSSRSMAKMKMLQPEMKALQERYKDDKQRLSTETMELYKREKVSPMSGCMPMFLQIPIFFALYKVLYVGIELRHAPLFGWIHDMSAPDPTSILTGFGMIDWAFIPHVGVWPLLMGVSMFLQQKMSPQPTDQSQAKVFQLLPFLFTFMMAKVAAGLIFYWTISNLVGIGQQWFIMHKTKGLHHK